MSLNRKRQIYIRYKEEIVYDECGETLEQIAQRSGCPIPGSVQVQAEWGFEKPELVEDVPDHGMVIGLKDLLAQAILCFYDNLRAPCF